MGDAAMRNEFVNYLNIGTIASPSYVLMGEGFTDLTDALNPDVAEKTYISDISATKRVKGYAAEWGFEADVIKDNTVIAFLREIGKTLATGTACETTMVSFDAWDTDAVTGIVEAYEYQVAVAMDSIAGGAGGEEGTMSGTLLGIGDPVAGTFNTASKVFTEDVIS